MTVSDLIPSPLSQKKKTQAQRGKINSPKLRPFLEAEVGLELRPRELPEVQSCDTLAVASGESLRAL